MAVYRAVARAEEGHQRQQRETVATSEQPNSEGGHIPDPEVMATIRQLPPYLQHVVTLMANMVPPNEESRMREKRRNEALEQATNMIMMVSFTSLP